MGYNQDRQDAAVTIVRAMLILPTPTGFRFQ